MSEYSYQESIERNNQEDKLDMERSIAELRERMIGSAFSAVQNYWKMQEENFDTIALLGYPEHATFDYYVLETYTGFPFQDEEPVRSLSLALVPEYNLATDEDIEKDQSKLTIFVPLPEECEVNQNLIIDELPTPTRIAVEHVSPNGLISNFIIDITGMSPFVNAIDSGDEAVESDTFEEDELNKLVDGKLRIRDDVEVIPKLFKHMVEWKALIQKSLPVKEMHWPDQTV